ncbi:hypothetical protein [Actinokineospora sp. NBRC 105648]|uniref:hypothetical protein n=1 Tax=Actinokineospora sp. NBRC 105648 TaxID=3032206 RepID=UPI0024A47C6E|nr:hypothetical protein [Actinokineospora sp. NBRC 105648]GLZ36904.1 hypothetical protein Acsp05_05290 [Actinokineospora sp. NBRC 105648]
MPAGLAALDPATGAVTSTIPVDRGDRPGPVRVGPLGTTPLEQRGRTLVALR